MNCCERWPVSRSTRRRSSALEIRRVSLREANAFVVAHHRRLGEVRGYFFGLGLFVAGELRGVAVVGRPTARMADDGRTAQVLRLPVNNTKNACSRLYGAVRRICIEMGLQAITYTFEDEDGTSLRAAGWIAEEWTDGGSWARANRPRADKAPITPKLRWRAA